MERREADQSIGRNHMHGVATNLPTWEIPYLGVATYPGVAASLELLLTRETLAYTTGARNSQALPVGRRYRIKPVDTCIIRYLINLTISTAPL